MPNIATVLKEEIARVARKETRADTQQLKKASAHYRSDIATLKRRIAALEKLVGRLGKQCCCIFDPLLTHFANVKEGRHTQWNHRCCHQQPSQFGP